MKTEPSDVARNLKRVRKALGLTQEQLGVKLGVTPQAVSQWEKSDWNPTVGRLKEIAAGLGVSVRSLTGVETTESSAPIVGNVAAGEPIEAIPRDGERNYVSPSMLADHPDAFFLAVRGDSMNRVFPSGMLVLVDPNAEVANRDIVVVNVNGDDATVKRILYAADTIVLHPESTNPEHKDRALAAGTSGNPRIVGKVVWATFPDRIRF